LAVVAGLVELLRKLKNTAKIRLLKVLKNYSKLKQSPKWEKDSQIHQVTIHLF